MITVIIPAINEEEIVGNVVNRVSQVMNMYGDAYEVLVVDDGSTDKTGIVAKKAGARVVRHAYNMGNGAAIKTGIRNARGNVIVMIDADGQHSPKDIPRLLDEISNYGMVVGARTKESYSIWYRDIANSVYNLFASYISGQRILDLTSGFRAIHTSLARQFLYLLPNTFSYPTTITLAIMHSGHSVKYIPIKVKRRVGKSKIRLIRDGSRFLVIIMKIATLFSPLKVFLPISIFFIGLGVFWYLYGLTLHGPRFPPASVVLILSGVFFFLMGLISEQIAQLRFDRSEDSNFYVLDTYNNSSDEKDVDINVEPLSDNEKMVQTKLQE
jgi:glycosyltransferase involved in cell wall biosynthesis